MHKFQLDIDELGVKKSLWWFKSFENLGLKRKMCCGFLTLKFFPVNIGMHSIEPLIRMKN